MTTEAMSVSKPVPGIGVGRAARRAEDVRCAPRPGRRQHAGPIEHSEDGWVAQAHGLKPSRPTTSS